LGKERDYRGERGKNDTHASITDPDAELMRKSNNATAELSYGVQYVMENRHGLVVVGGRERGGGARVMNRKASTGLPGADRDNLCLVKKVWWTEAHDGAGLDQRSRHVGYDGMQPVANA
jgi:hypothetical protein